MEGTASIRLRPLLHDHVRVDRDGGAIEEAILLSRIPVPTQSRVEDRKVEDLGKQWQPQLVVAEIGGIHRGILCEKRSSKAGSWTQASVRHLVVRPLFPSIRKEFVPLASVIRLLRPDPVVPNRRERRKGGKTHSAFGDRLVDAIERIQEKKIPLDHVRDIKGHPITDV